MISFASQASVLRYVDVEEAEEQERRANVPISMEQDTQVMDQDFAATSPYREHDGLRAGFELFKVCASRRCVSSKFSSFGL